MADENETLFTSGRLESKYLHVKNTKAKAEIRWKHFLLIKRTECFCQTLHLANYLKCM
jgi:hypothetical protein